MEAPRPYITCQLIEVGFEPREAASRSHVLKPEYSTSCFSQRKLEGQLDLGKGFHFMNERLSSS